MTALPRSTRDALDAAIQAAVSANLIVTAIELGADGQARILIGAPISAPDDLDILRARKRERRPA